MRRRLRLPPAVVVAAAFAAPVVVLAATPRSRRRDLLACTLYMWAHLNLYEMPNDDPAALAKRARVRYPIVVDRVLGLGTLPTVRLQHAIGSRTRTTRLDWRRLYGALGGNPLAAMPSLHFATAIISATTIAGPRRPERTLLGIYAGVLGFALVYLGEHYLVDLVAGAALAGVVEMADRRFRRQRIRWAAAVSRL